jgi:DNA-binding NarL/FixJ family response regulator
MPGMTGIEALPLIMAASPQTKAIMITGNATRSIVEAAVAGGAKGYFLKPIRPAKVEEFVKKLFRL